MLVFVAEFVVVARPRAEVAWVASRSGKELGLVRSRLAKQGYERLAVCLLGRVMKIEVVHVERKRAISIHLHQFPDLIHVTRCTVRGHPHDLVFALIYFKAKECGKRAIEQSNRVRKLHLL